MLFAPIKPMSLSMGTDAFDDNRYLFEPKYDGWRILLHKQGERLEAYTRSGAIVTDKFPELRDAVTAIKADTAILDCEGIVMRGGRPVFDDFSYRCRISDSIKIKHARLTHPVTFVVFDALFTKREHLHEPLTERKARLNEIVQSSSVITPTFYVEDCGKPLYDLTKEKDMEGIVAKKKDSIYIPGFRSVEWVKIKHVRSIDTVILGYRTEPSFALIVGLNFRTVKNKPVSIVEHGFGPEEKQAFLEIAPSLRVGNDPPIVWIEPRLCCRIEYLDRTDNHQLKTTEFKGFLLDKKAEECLWT